MDQINTTVADGVPVTITVHFQQRWKQRVGGVLRLPLHEIATELRDQPCGTFRVRLNKLGVTGCWAVVERAGLGLRFITVISGPWTGRRTPQVRLRG